MANYGNEQLQFNPDKLRQFRKNLNLSQRELSDIIGCSVDSVKNWENSRANPAGQFIERMMRLYYNEGFGLTKFYE